MKKDKEKDYFVAIPNRMFAFDTEYFTTKEELIVFYQLGLHVTARDPRISIVNIELLNAELELDRSHPTRGKKKIEQALLGLHDKGYIKMTFSGTKLKYTTHLTVKLPEMSDPVYTHEITSGSWKYKGFVEVTDDMFVRTKNIDQFKVLIYVKWRSFLYSKDKLKYAISYMEWESVLDVSHATAVKIIDDCVKEGLIVKHVGQYYTTLGGEPRQETNRYDVKEEKEQNNLDIVKAVNVVLHSDELNGKTIEKRKHQWFIMDSRINVDDMVVYLTTDCSVLKEHAEKRITGISKNENGKESMESLIRKAHQTIRKEEVEKKLQDKRGLEKMAEMKELWERENRAISKQKYQKKKASYDISDFLGDDSVADSKSKDEFSMFA